MAKTYKMVTSKCAVCGAVFTARSSSHRKCCSDGCTRVMKNRQRATWERNYKISPEQMSEVRYAQDCGDIEVLRASSARWTKEMHKYAKKRYEIKHAIWRITNPW